jgi:Putative adhesin
MGVPMAGTTTTAPARRSGRGLRLFLGLFALVLVAVGVWVGVGFLTLTSSQHHSSFPVVDDRVVIDVEAGSVRLTAGPPGVVEVDRRLRNDSLRKPRPSELFQGRTLVLRDGCARSGVMIFCESRYDLRVPPDLDFTVVNHAGGVRASGLAGPLDLRGDNGGITVDGATRTLRLRTSDGAITATNLRSTDVLARTSSGGIRLGFRVAPERVDAVTSDASVRLTVPAGSGPYDVEQHTTDGRTSVGVPTDPAATRKLTLRTSSGDISVQAAGS